MLPKRSRYRPRKPRPKYDTAFAATDVAKRLIRYATHRKGSRVHIQNLLISLGTQTKPNSPASKAVLDQWNLFKKPLDDMNKKTIRQKAKLSRTYRRSKPSGRSLTSVLSEPLEPRVGESVDAYRVRVYPPEFWVNGPRFKMPERLMPLDRMRAYLINSEELIDASKRSPKSHYRRLAIEWLDYAVLLKYRDRDTGNALDNIRRVVRKIKDKKWYQQLGETAFRWNIDLLPY